MTPAEIRREAARWHWVAEAWHNDHRPEHFRGTGPPERYHFGPGDFYLRQIARLLYGRRSRHLAGYRTPHERATGTMRED